MLLLKFFRRSRICKFYTNELLREVVTRLQACGEPPLVKSEKHMRYNQECGQGDRSPKRMRFEIVPILSWRPLKDQRPLKAFQMCLQT